MNRLAALSLAGFAGLAALQVGIPASMLVSRAYALRSGTEVRLAVVPRDPRSLTRGDYSNLNYAIAHFSNVKLPAEPSLCATGKPICFMSGLPAYVTLAPCGWRCGGPRHRCRPSTGGNAVHQGADSGRPLPIDAEPGMP
jgi:hypothetical protein